MSNLLKQDTHTHARAHIDASNPHAGAFFSGALCDGAVIGVVNNDRVSVIVVTVIVHTDDVVVGFWDGGERGGFASNGNGGGTRRGRVATVVDGNGGLALVGGISSRRGVDGGKDGTRLDSRGAIRTNGGSD